MDDELNKPKSSIPEDAFTQVSAFQVKCSFKKQIFERYQKVFRLPMLLKECVALHFTILEFSSSTDANLSSLVKSTQLKGDQNSPLELR